METTAAARLQLDALVDTLAQFNNEMVAADRDDDLARSIDALADELAGWQRLDAALLELGLDETADLGDDQPRTRSA